MACFVQIFIIYNTVKNAYLPTLKLKNKLETCIFFLGLKRKTCIYICISCMYVCKIHILYILGEYNLGVRLGLTEHIKHLECRSTEEIWNVYRISFLPSIMHCIVKTLRG